MYAAALALVEEVLLMRLAAAAFAGKPKLHESTLHHYHEQVPQTLASGVNSPFETHECLQTRFANHEVGGGIKLNQTIETIQKHVSVRAFTEQPLSEEQVRLLVTAAQAASSASFQQAYSIIGVTDPDLLNKISEEACHNDFIMDGGHFFVFCADVNRHKQLADDAQVDISKAINGIDAILVGAIDASLAAQNMVIAAESMGLGACYIGGIRDGIVKISELLNIPAYVFPVFGLIVGYPNECNDHKPRIPFEAIYHVNQYNNDTKAILKQYDEEMRLYYATRSGGKRDQTWSESVIRSFIRHSRGHMKKFLNDRGWAQD